MMMRAVSLLQAFVVRYLTDGSASSATSSETCQSTSTGPGQRGLVDSLTASIVRHSNINVEACGENETKSQESARTTVPEAKNSAAVTQA
jgi:hypothetical protein